MVVLIVSGLSGLVFGSLVGLLNTKITQKLILDQGDKADQMNKSADGGVVKVMLVNFLRYIISLLALLLVFLLRKVLPYNFTAEIIGTAAGLTIVSFVLLLFTVKGRE